MKKIIYSLLVILTSYTLTAQNDKDFKSFYKEYKQEKSIIALSAPVGLANLFIDRDEKELRRVIKKGKKVRILIFDEANSKLDTDIKSYFPKDMYEKFMSVKDNQTSIELFTKDTTDYISEMIIFIHDKNSLIAIGIDGKFSYDDLKTLTDSFQNEG